MADVAEDTAAAEIVGSVDDLLLEIFRRVQSKKDDRTPQFKLSSKHLNSQASEYYSIFRLRLVSRRWNSLISTNFPRNPKPFPAAGLIFDCLPISSKRHTPAPHSSYILFLDQTKKKPAHFREINTSDDTWHTRSEIVHSCNGLLLCASKRANGVYSVCNPTTGKHSALPQVPPANDKIIHGVSLAFDPCKSHHYKVFCVLGSEHDIRYFQFVVYSSKTGSWGNGGKLFKTKNVSFGNHNSGVCWNGAIHWVGSSELVRYNLDDDDDLSAPPKVTPMPIARDRDRYYFGESYGHLHYIGLDDGGREVVVHEMMSRDYSAKGWVAKYKVDVFNNRSYFSRGFEVYAVVRGETSEDTFLVLGTGSWGRARNRIIRYNLNDATIKTIYDFCNGSENLIENPEKLHPFQYIESLASV